MKNLTGKTSGKDKGIAIIFSIIMLTVFFLISFGFISMATSSKAAATAREPQQAAALSAEATVLNEAIFAMSKGLFENAGNQLDNPDISKFRTVNFRNTTSGKEAKFKGWGSRKDDTNAFDQTGLSTNISLQVLTTNDLTIDTNTTNSPLWSNLGWLKKKNLDSAGVDDRYCWLILDSNGIDPNYAGNSSGHLATRRYGTYVRELNMETIEAGFSNAYVDWTAGTPTVWTDKKTLINSLSSTAAASLETAIEIFEPGTTPVYIKAMEAADGKVDLSYANSGAVSPDDIYNGISWLNTSTDTDQANQIACNIADYLDTDNIASSKGGQYGKERVPYLNEFHLKITNDTVQPDPMDTALAETPSVINLEAKFETVNVFNNITTWNEGDSGSPNGAGAYFLLYAIVNAGRTGAPISDQPIEITISENYSSLTAVGYHESPSGDESYSTGATESSANNDLSNVSIQITHVALYGASGELWDRYDIDQTINLGTVADTDEKFCNFQATDPRNNHTGWDGDTDYDTDNNSFNAKNEDSGGASIYVVMDGETDDNGSDGDGQEEPWEISSAYMPADGIMHSLAELGMIPRGAVGETLNLCDYNIQTSDRFVSANRTPTANLDIGDESTFNGGDRALLDHVYLSDNEVKVNTSTDTVAYKQFGIINPNTSQPSVIQLLLSNITVEGQGAAISSTLANSVADNFPGMASSPDTDEFFTIDQFHDTTGDEYHNGNPTTYGFPFSSQHPSSVSMKETEREFLTINSMKLVSPKYSYLTILAIVQIMADATTVSSTSKVKALVRRDNQSGSYNIINKTIN